MSRKRLSKKQLKRDKFVQRTFDWAHWAETHRRELIGGAIALALLVTGFFVYRGVSRGAEEEAAVGFGRGLFPADEEIVVAHVRARS